MNCFKCKYFNEFSGFCNVEQNFYNQIPADQCKWLKELIEVNKYLKYQIEYGTPEMAHWAWQQEKLCCTNCGESTIPDETGYPTITPYCPWCGAEMNNYEELFTHG